MQSEIFRVHCGIWYNVTFHDFFSLFPSSDLDEETQRIITLVKQIKPADFFFKKDKKARARYGTFV